MALRAMNPRSLVLGVLLMACALWLMTGSARAAASWQAGAFQESTITDCVSIIDGDPFSEPGAAATAYVYEDYSNPPAAGQTYYLAETVVAVGDTCSGQAAEISFTLPPDTSLSISPATPVSCYPLELTNSGLSGGAADTSGACPQSPTAQDGDTYYFDMAANTGFDGGTGFCPFWGIPEGAGVEINIPVVSSTALDTTATANAALADGNDNPTLSPTVQVIVGPAPTTGSTTTTHTPTSTTTTQTSTSTLTSTETTTQTTSETTTQTTSKSASTTSSSRTTVTITTGTCLLIPTCSRSSTTSTTSTTSSTSISPITITITTATCALIRVCLPSSHSSSTTTTTTTTSSSPSPSSASTTTTTSSSPGSPSPPGSPSVSASASTTTTTTQTSAHAAGSSGVLAASTVVGKAAAFGGFLCANPQTGKKITCTVTVARGHSKVSLVAWVTPPEPRRKGHRGATAVPIQVGTLRLADAPAGHQALTVQLTSRGRSLLAASHPLAVKLVLSVTEPGATTASTGTGTVSLHAPRRHKRR